MSYLCFTPEEYKALYHICRRPHLRGCRLHVFKRFLIVSLSDTMPELAERIAQLRPHQLRILHDNLRERRKLDLTPAEVQTIVEACGPLLCHARFARPLRRVLGQHLREVSPDLAAKLQGMSNRQFEMLCDQVKERTRGGL